MEIIGTVEVRDTPLLLPASRHKPDGTICAVQNAVQEESLLRVYINDILTIQLGCSANQLVELVVGRLFTEGIISSADEIEAISICEFSMDAQVILRNREARLDAEIPTTVPTCCTNNKNLNNYFGTGEPMQPVVPIPWTPEWIFSIVREFYRDKTTHARTRGVHSAYLCIPGNLDEADEAGNVGRILCVCEDIGRHNAFDKAVGWALLHDIDLASALIFTSGRIPTDMVTKAIRSHIPILASKAVATDKTVEIAREFNLTLICNANTDFFDVMSDATC